MELFKNWSIEDLKRLQRLNTKLIKQSENLFIDDWDIFLVKLPNTIKNEIENKTKK